MLDGHIIVRFCMRELTSTLKDFGFSRKEADVYLAVLELGEAQISDIAKKVKLPRTSCYAIIKSLVNRHMLSYYVKRRTRLYIAESPRKIASFFENRASIFKEILPRLLALSRKTGAQPVIRFYEGEEGFKTILDEVIDEKRNFDAITSIVDAFLLLEGAFTQFIEQRQKRYLHVRLLTNKSKESEEMRIRDNTELRETRFVPAGYNFTTANWIFGDKVALLSLQKERSVGIVIEDKAIADTFRMYFELLWQAAERN